MVIHQFDTIIVGSGGSGLYAALEASQHTKTAVLSKLYPIRSHTGAAQGGISADLIADRPDRRTDNNRILAAVPEQHSTIGSNQYIEHRGAAIGRESANRSHQRLIECQRTRIAGKTLLRWPRSKARELQHRQ